MFTREAILNEKSLFQSNILEDIVAPGRVPIDLRRDRPSRPGDRGPRILSSGTFPCLARS